MKTELNESLIHSAYLDSDDSLYLYDKDEKDLEGWPKSWPEHIPCVQTFLKARGINYVNAPAPPTLAEIYGSKADTPPQPAHGESLTFSEVFGLPAGSFVQHLTESEESTCDCCNALKAKHEAVVKEFNERLVDRTTGMLDSLAKPRLSAASFRAGWEASMDFTSGGTSNLEQALQQHLNPPQCASVPSESPPLNAAAVS